MLFSSIIFLTLFLPVVLALSRLLPERWRNAMLLAASLLFYAWGEPRYIGLMLASIILNYGAGLLMAYRPRTVLTLAVVLNLAMLGVCKYLTPSLSAIDRVWEFQFELPSILLPIGISFYTFQGMSYVIDVYRRTIAPQRNPVELALYIALFPQLIAGPIVKYHDIMPQLAHRELSPETTAYGVRRFILGLAKKILIANPMGALADNIFAVADTASLDTPTAWLGALAYALQIYYDFSGYSDMAIGLGKMFGFTFAENFNYPYLSRSVQEFWRRWHISLSSWFKEYLYIPLGGSAGGLRRTCVNIMIVFFATGIWHGAGLNFVFWGVYYGALLVVERIFLGEKLKNAPAWLARTYLLLAVLIGWVFFRAETFGKAGHYLAAMFRFNRNPELPLSTFAAPGTWVVIAAGVLLCGPLQQAFPAFKARLFRENTGYADIPVLALLFAASFLMLSVKSYNPFIYFRF